MTNQPLKEFRYKAIKLTIWPAKNGGFQCSQIKSYKPKDLPEGEKWPNTNTYFPNEGEEVIKLWQLALDWISENSKDTVSGLPVLPFDPEDIPF